MGSLPVFASDGLDLTVYSVHRVIMVCSVATSRIHFLVEGEPAVIEEQSWFHFLSGNELHD